MKFFKQDFGKGIGNTEEINADRILVYDGTQKLFAFKINQEGNLVISSDEGLKIIPKASNVLEILPDIDS